MEKENLDIKPTETKVKLKLPDGNLVVIGSDAVNLENGKSDPKAIIREIQKHIDKDIFKDTSDGQFKSDSK